MIHTQNIITLWMQRTVPITYEDEYKFVLYAFVYFF